MSSGKSYGLLVPKKGNQGLLKRHSAFGEESGSDGEAEGGWGELGGDWLKKSLQQSSSSGSMKRQTKLDIQKAITQDSSVYLYDEIYDQIEIQKQELNPKEKEKKPKYIQNLMTAAEKRKRETERRVERQVQKEREAEGEQFKDKETFVTSAYKKKLEEFAKLDEEQRRQDVLEEIGDVTKQPDISGFYRHMYQASTSSGKTERKEDGKPDDKKKKDDKKPEEKKEKNYRKRKSSRSSDDEKNQDADTDQGSSSSESGRIHTDSETDNPKRQKNSEEVKVEKVSTPASVTPPQEDKKPVPKEMKPVKKQPDRSIWEKRTVGPVFDAALQRYYERKSAKGIVAY